MFLPCRQYFWRTLSPMSEMKVEEKISSEQRAEEGKDPQSNPWLCISSVLWFYLPSQLLPKAKSNFFLTLQTILLKKNKSVLWSWTWIRNLHHTHFTNQVLPRVETTQYVRSHIYILPSVALWVYLLSHIYRRIKIFIKKDLNILVVIHEKFRQTMDKSS